MAENFQLQIITPDRMFYEGEASMVEFTSVDGEMGVYKHHIPLTTESLYLSGTVYNQLIIFRQFIHTKDCDNILYLWWSFPLWMERWESINIISL